MKRLDKAKIIMTNWALNGEPLNRNYETHADIKSTCNEVTERETELVGD